MKEFVFKVTGPKILGQDEIQAFDFEQALDTEIKPQIQISAELLYRYFAEERREGTNDEDLRIAEMVYFTLTNALQQWENLGELQMLFSAHKKAKAA